MPLRVIQHYSDWVCTAVMSNDVMKDLKIFHNVITHNRGTNPVTIMLLIKHCLSLKTIIPNIVAFFVSLGIVISCVRKMSFSVTSAEQEFTPAIVSLSTSREVDNVH